MPSLTTSSSLIACWDVEQPADVLRDLGDVLDEEEADLVRHRPDATTRPRSPRPEANGPARARREGQCRRTPAPRQGVARSSAAAHEDDAAPTPGSSGPRS